MYLAFDPGMKNLGVWAGADPEHTEKLGCFDLKKKRKPLYEAVVELLTEREWMCDPATIKEAVVETQAPRNIPSRIVATSIYCFLKGRGVNVRFSGSHLKDRALEFYSKKLGIKLIEKPVGKMAASKRYRVNKKNAINVVSALMSKPVLGMFKKLDDVCDATLLGAGLFIENKEFEI